MLGAFTPLTMEGNIIIVGVLTSCYAFPDHDMAHIAMTPVRWFPHIVESIVGTKNGSPEFINVAQEFGSRFGSMATALILAFKNVVEIQLQIFH